MLKVGLNQCHFVEIDPKPDLPLDKMIWGSPVFIKPPQSNYQMAF